MDEAKGQGMDESRLKRFEDKLDRLAESMSELIRLDERMVTLFKRMDHYDQRQERLSDRMAALERGGSQVTSLLPLVDRVTALEVVNHRRGPLYIWAERIVIALVTAGAVLLIRMLFGAP